MADTYFLLLYAFFFGYLFLSKMTSRDTEIEQGVNRTLDYVRLLGVDQIISYKILYPAVLIVFVFAPIVYLYLRLRIFCNKEKTSGHLDNMRDSHKVPAYIGYGVLVLIALVTAFFAGYILFVNPI